VCLYLSIVDKKKIEGLWWTFVIIGLWTLLTVCIYDKIL
jgi:hypothetical protein